MKIGVNCGSHLMNLGGGFKAVYWHIRALSELQNEVTVFVTSAVHPAIIPKLHGLSIRWYKAGVESGFDGFLTVNHFAHGLPLAKRWNACHIFFPHLDSPPPEGIQIFTNSQYTAAHVRNKWNREATPVYIPIESDYYVGRKENIILHVSRISEPNEWADKGHQQMIQLMRMIRGDLPNWKLILAGAVELGQSGYVNGLMEMASGYPVDFMFDPNDKELHDLYSRASIMWHCTGISLPTIPSAQEHLGLAPLEASASGCVPIVYNSGGMPEVVLNHRTGMLFDDMRQCGQMTVEMTRNWHVWAAMVQQGQSWARAWQDYDAFKERVQQMLEGKPISPLPDYFPKMQHTAKDVTIAIPTFNSPDMLQRCLASLKATAPNAKVIVMNNGDPLPAMDGACIHDMAGNLGFAGAYKWLENSGLIDTDFILMLNDDIEAKFPNWLEFLLLPMNDPTVGITGAKLLFPDGRLQHAGGEVDFNRDDVGYHRWYGMPDSTSANITEEVEFVTGACMMMRSELFHAPEELTDGLCYEEAWISSLARERGFKTIYQPAACLIHHERTTRKRTPDDEAKVERNKQAFVERWRK